MTVTNAILRKHFEKMGFDSDFFKVYESETDDVMQSSDLMCEMLHCIHSGDNEITIYTDFDVDGIMSSVISYAGFSQLGFKVNLFKPSPHAGYGFRIADVDAIMAEFPNTSVIFTGDVGIRCNETIDYARSKGLLVLVTDHHIGKTPCTADVSVNPNQFGETYSHNGICGAYVIYQLLEEYTKRYDADKLGDIVRLQVFAGIATISDTMPLLYENRQLVRNSINIARFFYSFDLADAVSVPVTYADNYARAFTGLKQLLLYFAAKHKIKTADDIDEQFYGFYLVPFLNSCKRMDGDMRGVYDIFFASHVSAVSGFENMPCVEAGINYLEKLNERRKELTESYFNILTEEKESGETRESAYMQSEVYITCVNAGLCGLLANKLMGQSDMPTMVLVANEDGSFSGSGRCPGWLDLSAELCKNDIPIFCEGHKEAFGVYVPDASALDRYVVFFDDVIIPAFGKAVREETLFVDTSISISNTVAAHSDFMLDAKLIREFLHEKDLFHPFGRAFPAPYFTLFIDPCTVTAKMFGTTAQHIKLVTQDGIEIMLFNQALDYETLKYYNTGKKYLFVCKGVFRFDDFDKSSENISFFCDEISVLGGCIN